MVIRLPMAKQWYSADYTVATGIDKIRNTYPNHRFSEWMPQRIDWLDYNHLCYFWMVARHGGVVRAREVCEWFYAITLGEQPRHPRRGRDLWRVQAGGANRNEKAPAEPGPGKVGDKGLEPLTSRV